ncbi:DegV family protein [Paucisalibacillus globulus]|jgi:DegV family protein with EDD domain|uniref:DegV family protein n=1 Tax=Paucisalibacillus globulus TaxID=351095 RepID=UPI00041AA645|nr:DegV family protein [Paucisalibacillus globulus]
MANKKIAFVTDSTVYLTDKLKSHPDIYVVPIVIISDGKEYEDTIDLTNEELYEMIRREKEVPKTSQPNVGKFIELYEKLKEEYEQVIAIHVSSKLSGTISSSKTAVEQVGLDVEIIDSHSLSFAITGLLESGIELAEQGLESEQIARLLREKTKGHRNLILLDKLDQLFKGGRMTGASFVIGNLLKIKPILSIGKSGELGLVERIRSEKKSTRRMVDLIKTSCEKHAVKKIAIANANAPDKANSLKEIIRSKVPGLDIVIGEISSSLAVHAGEGAIAVFWFE